MEDQELENLLKDLESDRTERKVSISDQSKIRQAICAFANDLPNHQQPGVLFIGVNDDGSCANLTITDRTRDFPLSFPWKTNDLDINPNSPEQKITWEYPVFWDKEE